MLLTECSKFESPRLAANCTDRTQKTPRNLGSIFALAGILSLAGCTSAINATNEACASSRATAAAFADCLRRNYGMLVNGSPDQGDLGALYLAAAEYEAAQVAGGYGTDAQAMLELAVFRMKVLGPIEQQRRDVAFQNFMKALEAAQNHASSPRRGSVSAQSQAGHSYN